MLNDSQIEIFKILDVDNQMWRRSVSMYTLYDTPSRKWTKFFLVTHWGPKLPGNPLELILALFQKTLKLTFFKF